MHGHPRSKQRYTEDDWTVLDNPAARNHHMRSKAMAARLARDLAGDSALIQFEPRRSAFRIFKTPEFGIDESCYATFAARIHEPSRNWHDL
jgi:hypothetical protein